MELIDRSFDDPQVNLSYDDLLLQRAEQGEGEFLRFWESPVPFIVLGRISKPEEDVDLGKAHADGIPVLRRSSGGGTVMQGPGCLNYSLILSKQKSPTLNDLRRSYLWISEKVIAALKAVRVDACFMPLSDLAAGADLKKFSGNAQKRGKLYILHHGTILYGFDLELISKYLRLPKDVPAYRNNRLHKDFIANQNVDTGLFKLALAKQFEIS